MKHRREIADDLKLVFEMDNKQDSMDKAAYNRAKNFSDKWSKFYPHINKFADVDHIRYYFTNINFNHKTWRMIYTNNWIECFNKDIKRTTKIRNSMPSVDSVLTLMSKVAMNMNSAHYLPSFL